MKKVNLLILLLCLCLYGTSQNLLPPDWKFRTGDNPEWAQNNYNDADWKIIPVTAVWEQNGYPSYDGYAWYRVTVVIPSSLKKDAKKYGGFLLQLGKIDDVDFTYFNGELIGQTGELPPHFVTKCDEFRTYTIPSGKIRWNKPNTIAVRVFDLSGNGGIFAGPPALVIRELFENVIITPQFKQENRIILGKKDISIPIELDNHVRKALDGTLTLRVLNDVNKEIFSGSQSVSLRKKGSMKTEVALNDLKPGFYKGVAILESGLFRKQVNFNFGYEPEKYIVPTDRQPDFEEFWAAAKAELKQVDPRYRMIKVDSLCTATKDLYLVEMYSLRDALIRGWLSMPKAPGKYPVIMQVPGYSTNILPTWINYGDDFIGFGLNIRGHGNSCDDVNPGFPGYILYNLANKDKYIYRGAYMDCVRAVDFICTLPQADLDKIVVEGASQGGALTFATAALNNDRIRLCVPQVPFLSDFPHYFKVASWPGNEFYNYVEVEKKETWDEVFRTLSYFDIKNLAPWIKAPMLMSVGLCDEVCPPPINFAAFNNVPGKKSYIAYPLAGHGVPQDFYVKKMEWIRKELKMK